MRALALVAALAGCEAIVHFDYPPARNDAPMNHDGPSDAAQNACAPACGAGGTSPCCLSATVAGGNYGRGFDKAGDGLFVDDASPATVSTFNLDVYEVTVARFRARLGAVTQQSPPVAGSGARTLNGGMQNQAGWDPSWNTQLVPTGAQLSGALSCGPGSTWTPVVGSHETLPINCVTWYEAFAFCVSDGGFLPTEVQWEYAAAGGASQLPYPWSNPPTDLTIDCAHANFTANAAAPCSPVPDRVGSQSPTGDGMFGHADMAGNVSEWVLDVNDVYAVPCDDCADLAFGTSTFMGLVHGGDFTAPAMALRGANRISVQSAQRLPTVGFRCARM